MIAFGPVSSRRLGKSLGINNIVTGKYCSYSCVYCQIGKTKNRSVLRQEFYKPEVLLREVEQHLNKLDKNHFPDFLTFVANGEPTLDVNLGIEIDLLKKFGIPVAVITNASLIYQPEVVTELLKADWVSVKIDSCNETAWKEINRPAENLYLNEILDGIKVFSKLYRGRLNTETMLVQGINDSVPMLEQNVKFISSINPETAYLSIPVRPPAEEKINPVREEILNEAWQIYKNAGINTELIAGFEGTDTGSTGNAYDDILNITAVHPLREDTIEELLRKNNADISVVEALIGERLIKEVKYDGKSYYVRSYNQC